jgi:hypothetical protein
MAFAEFVCRSGGSNMNGGGLASGAEPGTSAAYTSTNGNWNGTATFTPTDGSTPNASVNAGDWASVYNDGATTPVYIARVVSVGAGVNGIITLHTTFKSGTAPTSSATGRTIKVGGAWLGPNGAVSFPFNFLVPQSMLSVAGDTPRVNFKNDQTYTISAAMTHGTHGPMLWQGYTTTFGDLGRATITGGTTGVSFTLLSIASVVDHVVSDFIFDHNGATGSADGIAGGTIRTQVTRCVFRNMVGAGADEGVYIECEAYGNNTGNGGGSGGFISLGSTLFCVNCISHDNAGSNSNGFYCQSAQFVAINCISAHNGSHGFNMNNMTGPVMLHNCDTYNNAGSGLRKQGGSSCPVLIRNSNFVKNGAWGIDLSGSSAGIEGTLYNNGYGAGTQANVSGKINGGAVYEVGPVNYASGVTPWVDPANGDFRINLAAAQGKGRGAFPSLMAGFSGTVAYPDIGAGQSDASAGGGGGGGGLLVNPGLWGGMS